MAERYISFSEIAAYLDVKTGTLANYRLPEPDAYIGKTRGWKKETIEKWNANRPRARKAK
ncbi:hypothetical protein [Alloscardovia criceti]|uniref:hypothetical protein n=1 Tax=Alloscardovia criceti TaxID=356828 RepID=UPI0003753299|nr:hypothetical protein [Alloscardovia criceti]